MTIRLIALVSLALVSAGPVLAQTAVVNFDSLADGASASLDPTAQAQGITFLSGYQTDVLDEFGDPIPGQTRFEAYDDSDIRAVDPALFGRAPAPSGERTVNALFDQLLIRFDKSRSLTGFGFAEDPSSFGDLFTSSVFFLDAGGNTLFTAGPFTPNSSPDNRYAFNFEAAKVSQILLPSTSKLYDDLTFAFVPEPASWAMMVMGFGLLGIAMRRRRAIISGN